MMNDKQQLKKRIQQLELQIKKLSLTASESEVGFDLYNSLIMQKAVLKKQLEDLEKNHFVHGVRDNIRKIFSRKEKLICDYFN